MFKVEGTALLARIQCNRPSCQTVQLAHTSHARPQGLITTIKSIRGYLLYQFLLTANNEHLRYGYAHYFAHIMPTFCIWHAFCNWLVLCPVLPIFYRYCIGIVIYSIFAVHKNFFLWLELNIQH